MNGHRVTALNRFTAEQLPIELPAVSDELARRAVGFSGSRMGMSELQRRRLRHLLLLHSATELHHGDCKGADAQAHEIARELNLRVILHPPTSKGLRAFCDGDEERMALPYLARNHMIVRETQFLIAAPNGPEQLRSGTWSTIRYCRLRHKNHEIIPWTAH